MAGVVKPLGFDERQPAELARRFAPHAATKTPRMAGAFWLPRAGCAKVLKTENESEPSSVRATELQ